MLDRNGTVAHWLGQMLAGKRLFEPINVILFDTAAASADDAPADLASSDSLRGGPLGGAHLVPQVG
jgi:hypothetical protein